MNILNVTFDLFMERVESGMKYDALFAEMKNTDSFSLWRTSWLLATSETPAQVRDRLSKHLHKNDQIFVNEVHEWAAFANTRGLKWLRTRRSLESVDTKKGAIL